ncbi:TolC family protein [Flavihumibacter sp. R14]|nr:TolC family protein [Flavihumibacter soli]
MINKKLLLLTCICLLGFPLARAQNSQIDKPSLTLEESVNIALKNNLEVRQNGLQAQSASILLKQSKWDMLPSISGNIGHGRNQGRSIDPFTNAYIDQNVSFANYSLSGGITLFNGLLLQNTIKQNSFAFEAAKMEQQQAKDALTLNVILNYLQILSNEDLLNQSILQARVSEEQVKRLQVLDKEGAIAPSLLFELQGQLANDELAIVTNRNTLNLSKLSLSRLMNTEYDPELTFARLATDKPEIQGEYPYKKDDIVTLALNQLSLIKGTAFRKQSAIKGLQASRSLRYPNLSLNSNLFSNFSSLAYRNEFGAPQPVTSNNYVSINGTDYPVIMPERPLSSQKINYNDQIKNNFSSSFSINLRIPIFNTVYAKSRIAQAKVDLMNAELIEETTQLQLKQAVDQAYFNMQAAKERYEAITRQVEAFKKSFSAAEVRFNAGATTSVDYSVAKNNFDRASINLINIRYEYILRTKILDYYRGALELN